MDSLATSADEVQTPSESFKVCLAKLFNIVKNEKGNDALAKYVTWQFGTSKTPSELDADYMNDITRFCPFKDQTICYVSSYIIVIKSIRVHTFDKCLHITNSAL